MAHPTQQLRKSLNPKNQGSDNWHILPSNQGNPQILKIKVQKWYCREKTIPQILPILKSLMTDENQVVLLENNFNTNEKNRRSDLIAPDDIDRKKNKIIHTILELLK